MSPPKRLSAPGLHGLIRRLLMAAATPRHIADVVAAVLVNSNLAGHDSHGVLHLPRYLKSIADAQLDAAAEPAVVRETAASLVIDGRDGHGHYVARWGMRRLLEKAAENEFCRASFRRIQHIGRLGEYAEMAAREGFIGIVLYGGSGSCTLPYGGAKGALGTNPIAAGIPTSHGPPFVLDYATSRIAISKALLARSRGLPLPAGCIVDRDGNPSVDPEAYFEGGNLLGFGGHKGYALSLLVGLLCGLSGENEAGDGRIVGHVMLVMNVDDLTPLGPYREAARAFLDRIKSTPPAPGFDEVIVPGDFEHRSRLERLRHGIEIPPPTWAELEECGRKLGVELSGAAAEPDDEARYRG